MWKFPKSVPTRVVDLDYTGTNYYASLRWAKELCVHVKRLCTRRNTTTLCTLSLKFKAVSTSHEALNYKKSKVLFLFFLVETAVYVSLLSPLATIGMRVAFSYFIPFVVRYSAYTIIFIHHKISVRMVEPSKMLET